MEGKRNDPKYKNFPNNLMHCFELPGRKKRKCNEPKWLKCVQHHRTRLTLSQSTSLTSRVLNDHQKASQRANNISFLLLMNKKRWCLKVKAKYPMSFEIKCMLSIEY